jgi:hypothetical protein
MRYLCLGYRDERAWSELPVGERQALQREMIDYGQLLRQNGSMIEANRLASARAATTLRFEKGAMSINEGPCPARSEQLGEIMLLEAKDLNRAIQLMAQLPCMRVGGFVEIRPLNETTIHEESIP